MALLINRSSSTSTSFVIRNRIHVRTWMTARTDWYDRNCDCFRANSNKRSSSIIRLPYIVKFALSWFGCVKNYSVKIKIFFFWSRIDTNCSVSNKKQSQISIFFPVSIFWRITGKNKAKMSYPLSTGCLKVSNNNKKKLTKFFFVFFSINWHFSWNFL